MRNTLNMRCRAFIPHLAFLSASWAHSGSLDGRTLWPPARLSRQPGHEIVRGHARGSGRPPRFNDTALGSSKDPRRSCQRAFGASLTSESTRLRPGSTHGHHGISRSHRQIRVRATL